MLPITDLNMPGTIPEAIPGGAWEATREDRPTLVLLHVFGLSRREWIEASVALAPQFRVLSIDTPGFGEAREIPGYSVAEMADSVEQTLAALHLPRFVLVGHSMTGKVAAVVASRQPAGLEKLVLLTPSPLSPEPIAPADRETMLGQAIPTRADAEEYLRANSCLPIPPEVFTRSVEDRLRANPAAWRAWLEAGSYEDWTDRVPSLDLPTLVIAAERDKSLGPDVQRELTLPRFPNGRLDVVAKCGHLVPLEAPARLAELIGSFAGV